MPRPTYNCPKCSKRAFTLMKLVKHIGLIHAHEPNFSITCGLNNCQRSFKNFQSVRRHVYRKHRENIFCSNLDPAVEITPAVVDDLPTVTNVLSNLDPAVEITPAVVDDLPTVTNVVAPSVDDLLHNFKKNLFSFVLKCREKNHLPISVQEDIVNDVNFLLCFFKENYDSFIAFHLNKSGFSITDSPELTSVIQSKDFFDEAYKAVRTPYMIRDHCKSQLNMTEPVHFQLRNSEGHSVGSYSYVPIRLVLKSYLSHEDIRDQILLSTTQHMEKECLSDYTDGEIYKDHQFFKDHPDALRLHFYEDEFGVVNPLGSIQNKHKLCGFYYNVGNLDPRHRSQQSHIHLALLVRYAHVKQFGLNTILKPMIDDLKTLATEGFKVNWEGTEHTVYAALATISGDNLSAHMLGGFTMSFNSGRICRYCMATHADIKDKFCETDFVLRTKEVHQSHLARIDQCPEDKVTYGVNSRSPFEELPYFDVTTSLPPDAMHDLLEGVIPLVLKLVISKAHTEKHITVTELNEELRKLSIGQNDKRNKPVKISERVKTVGVSGSASQKWCLFRLLPFAMAHRVPFNCEYWNVFLLLREISDIVMAHKAKKEELPLLNVLVYTFLNKLKDVFGGVMTPKCHYLIHYARLIEQYGPLRLLWCMRFESKHQYFKIVARNCRNFINIATTLSNRHQFRQCWEFSSQSLLSEFENVPGKSVSTPFSSLPVELQRALMAHHEVCNVRLHEDNAIQRVSKLILNNVKYAVKDVFLIDEVHSEKISLFFQIKYIFNINTIWLLCGKVLLPLSYDQHFHAYSVQVQKEWTVLLPGNELDSQAHDIYCVDNNVYVF